MKYGEPETYELIVDESEKAESKFGEEAVRLISRVESWNDINVCQKLRLPHPLVAESRDSFSVSDIDKYGRFRPWKKRYLDMRITPKTLRRSLRIMDTLIKKLEMLGFEICVEQDYHSSTTRAIILGEKVSFFIFEKVRQINHILTKKEKEDLKKYPNLSLAPK